MAPCNCPLPALPGHPPTHGTRVVTSAHPTQTSLSGCKLVSPTARTLHTPAVLKGCQRPQATCGAR
eukprot:1195069-Prymnesium_polylepis.2